MVAQPTSEEVAAGGAAAIAVVVGVQNLPRVTKGRRVRRACHVYPREVEDMPRITNGGKQGGQRTICTRSPTAPSAAPRSLSFFGSHEDVNINWTWWRHGGRRYTCQGGSGRVREGQGGPWKAMEGEGSILLTSSHVHSMRPPSASHASTSTLPSHNIADMSGVVHVRSPTLLDSASTIEKLSLVARQIGILN